MAALLGAPATGYRGIAAVTTGETGAARRSAPADRVIVNPEAYGVLGDFGRQVVLTHETTHVATRADTSAATPLWLSEGFADWVGYRGTGRTPPEAAPELPGRRGAAACPPALPADDDFGFGGDADALARGVRGRLAGLPLIAERWGEAKLTAFYRAVGGHRARGRGGDGPARRAGRQPDGLHGGLAHVRGRGAGLAPGGSLPGAGRWPGCAHPAPPPSYRREVPPLRNRLPTTSTSPSGV